MSLPKQEVLDLIASAQGRIFGVHFHKRSEGHELRKMRCRIRQRPGTYGVSTCNWKLTNLVPVFDVDIREYRSIPLEGVVRLAVDGEIYES